MWTASCIQKNEHNSTEELSTYMDYLSNSPLPKEELSPLPTKNQKGKSKRGKGLPHNVLSLSWCNLTLGSKKVTEAHPSSKDGSSDILNMSDFPPPCVAGMKPIIYESKSGDRERQLCGKGMACFLVHNIISWYYRNKDTLNKENEAPSGSSGIELVSTPPCNLTVPLLMSPLWIKRKASVISIMSSEADDEESGWNKCWHIIVSTA